MTKFPPPLPNASKRCLDEKHFYFGNKLKSNLKCERINLNNRSKSSACYTHTHIFSIVFMNVQTFDPPNQTPSPKITCDFIRVNCMTLVWITKWMKLQNTYLISGGEGDFFLLLLYPWSFIIDCFLYQNQIKMRIFSTSLKIIILIFINESYVRLK